MSTIIGKRIKMLRKDRNFTQEYLSDYLHVGKSTISQYETGRRIPSDETKKMLASLFGVSVDYLIGNSDNPQLSSNLRPLSEGLTAGIKIPVLGKVPAGVPIEAVEDIIDEIELTATMANDRHEYFALLVSGNSMYPEYMDGDIVIVRKQETAETGDDVVAYVNGYDATLKRLVRSMRGITLRPLNPEFEPHTYSNEEIESIPVRIAGIVVEQRRNRR